MIWVKLALVALQVANAIMEWAHERELISEGYDKAIAEQSQAILAKTTAGKAILEKVNGLSDADVDAQLRGLEPK